MSKQNETPRQNKKSAIRSRKILKSYWEAHCTVNMSLLVGISVKGS